jgi:hypothetical protein
MDMPADTIVEKNARAAYRRLGDDSGAVILHLDTAAYHSINESGAAIWALIEDGITFGTLLERVGSRFEVPHADLEQDLRDFLKSLNERDLVDLNSVDLNLA